MNLDKRYDEIMSKIRVTDEMRERILNNLQVFGSEENRLAKGRHFYLAIKWLSIAACFVVLTTAMFITLCGPIFSGKRMEPYSGEETREVSSLSELSAAVNFEVKDIEHLPFLSLDRLYTVVENDTAQIKYFGNGESAVFRKSAGNEDNSGDFTEYSKIREINVGATKATLKGYPGAFTLAVWSDGDFSYSLKVTGSLSATEWKALIEEIVAEKP